VCACVCVWMYMCVHVWEREWVCVCMCACVCLCVCLCVCVLCVCASVYSAYITGSLMHACWLMECCFSIIGFLCASYRVLFFYAYISMFLNWQQALEKVLDVSKDPYETVCMHAHTHKHTDTHTHIHICIYHDSEEVHIPAALATACMWLHVFMYIYVYIYICSCANIHAYICILYIYIYIYSMTRKKYIHPRLVRPPLCDSICKPNVSAIRSSDVGIIIQVAHV